MIDARTARFYEENAANYFAATSSKMLSGTASFFGEAFTQGGRILDFGSGSGRDLLILLDDEYDAWGYEPSENLVIEAVSHVPAIKGRLFSSIESFEEESFDGILASAVFQHIPDTHLGHAFSILTDLLVPGGTLLWSVPAGRSDLGLDFRDPHGRLFLLRPRSRYLQLLSFFGFSEVRNWHSDDRLNRRDIRWNTWLMQKTGEKMYRQP